MEALMTVRECYEIVKAADVLKLQKVVKTQIDNAVAQLRVLMNKAESYLKFVEKDLDIKLEDFGLRTTRAALSKNDLEKSIAEGRTLVINIKRNAAKLEPKGLTKDGIDELNACVNELDMLNEKHNTMKNSRSRAADDTSVKLNQLWDIINMITSTGRALYKGVDPVKLKEYTMSHLQKRVYNVNSNTETPAEPVQQ